MTTGLSDADIRQFARDGWVAPVPAVPADRAAGLALRIAEWEKRTGRAAIDGFRAKGHLVDEALLELARTPAMLDAVGSLIGPNILLWGGSLFVKDPAAGTSVGWHQDSWFWKFAPETGVTAWVALTPSTEENGALMVVSGSHRAELLPHESSTPESTNMLLSRCEIPPERIPAGAVTLELRPGEMSLHHLRTIHGSAPNRGRQRRLGFAATYLAPSVARTDGRRERAILLRGTDRFRHFDPEAPAGPHRLRGEYP